MNAVLARIGFLVISVVLNLAGAEAVCADQTGVAFDEIAWNGDNRQPPLLTSFATDRATLLQRAAAPDHYPNLQGPDDNVPRSAGPKGTGFTRLYRYAYLGDWVRIDDPIAMTATISRPDLSQTIFLDLRNKTFRVVGAPPPTASPTISPVPTPVPTPTPPTYTYKIESLTEPLPPGEINGVAVTGISITTTLTTLRAERACAPMELKTRWIEYFATDYLGPPGQHVSHHEPVLEKDCATELVPSAERTESGLLMYRRIDIVARVLDISVPALIFVLQRGNLTRLGPEDSALFAVPADFQKQAK